MPWSWFRVNDIQVCKTLVIQNRKDGEPLESRVVKMGDESCGTKEVMISASRWSEVWEYKCAVRIPRKRIK